MLENGGRLNMLNSHIKNFKVPLVSVIITTYNRPTYLLRAINSVDKQTYKNIEIIIVDDNNSNSDARCETQKVINEYRGLTKLIYIKHDKNKNGATARNTGIKNSSGDYIAFLDDDDYFYPDKVEKQVKILKNLDEQYGGIISNFEIFRNGKKINYPYVVNSGNYLVETLSCTFQMGSGSNLFVRRNVLKELGGFDETFERHQDYEFLVRFFLKYDLFALDEKLFGIEQKAIQNNKKDLIKMINIKKQYLNKYKNILDTLSKKEQAKILRNNKIQLLKIMINNKQFFHLLYICKFGI